MLKSLIYRFKQKQRVKPFLALNGDKTLRQEYDLNENLVVFDVGGYEGQWASDIFARYACLVHVFEPVPAFANAIIKRFKSNPKIIVHQAGLAGTTEKKMIDVSGDASSLIKNSGHLIEIDLLDVAEFWRVNNIGTVDLMKINIEGAEYELLERMIKAGLIGKVKNIQVQFHDFFPGAEARMEQIKTELEKTHRPTYQFKFVWENWTLK